MFDLIKNTILSGNYKFIDLQKRIARLYAMGNISEDELGVLISMAAEKANHEQERPETLELIQKLAAKVDALAADVAALMDAGSGGNAAGDNASGYDDWQSWDGLSDRYQPGTVIRHNGKLWQSTFPGQNVWEPGVVGEQFWIIYTPAE